MSGRPDTLAFDEGWKGGASKEPGGLERMSDWGLTVSAVLFLRSRWGEPRPLWTYECYLGWDSFCILVLTSEFAACVLMSCQHACAAFRALHSPVSFGAG